MQKDNKTRLTSYARIEIPFLTLRISSRNCSKNNNNITLVARTVPTQPVCLVTKPVLKNLGHMQKSTKK